MRADWWAGVVVLALAAAAPAKTGRVLHSDEAIARARQMAATVEWAKQLRDGLVANCDWVLKLSDAELWDYVPPPEQRRALNVSFGWDCPVHGPEIFRKGGHYPWLLDKKKPFKVTCPIGGESYPSNEFKPWNPGDQLPEQGPGYVDHGTGWVDAHGRRYWFVGYYVFWERWQAEILPAVTRLGTAYLLTGDARYAHKAAVLLSRIAGDYAQYNYHTQAYHNGGYPNAYNGRILDHIWMTGVVTGAAQTYDAIYPTLKGDAELTSFLAGKGIPNVTAHVEQKLLGQMAKDILDGTIRGNNGMHQQALANVAAVLANDDPQYAPTTAQLRDWLLYGGGDVEQLLWNGFYRDGHGGESSPGYSSGWCVNFYELAKLLPLIGADVWANPKVKKMADIGLDLAVNGLWTPDIGDSGGLNGSKRIGWSPVLQGEALRHYDDPRFAQAMKLTGARVDNLWDAPVQAKVDAAPTGDLNLRTRDLGGYGLAVLEGGTPQQRRGLSLYYGHAGGGHGHRDRLTLEYWAFGRPLLTDMGYPAHWLEKNTWWTSNTVSHYAVVVDQRGQESMNRGSLVSLASAPAVQFVEAEADTVAYPGRTSRYRRATAMVDLDQGGYLVDIYRVTGGKQHDWSFHGPAFPGFETQGLTLTPQAKGTVLGEDVPFAGDPAAAHGTALPAPDKFTGVIATDARPYADRSLLGWAQYSSGSILTRKVGAQAKLTADLPAGPVYVQLRVHDYRVGKGAVTVQLGGQSVELAWGGSAEEGSRWVTAGPITLPGGPTEVTLTAKTAGQNYVLVQGLAITRDASTPEVGDLRQSGFQYLYNVRRAQPAGGWSATWTKADEDLHLTVTVPEGCAREVLVCDAEPELAPGNPDKEQYLLGRNRADAAPLSSTYVAVVEAYQGSAKLKGIRRLPLLAGPAQAVALAIDHAGGTDLVYSSDDPATPAQVTWAPGQTVTCRGRFVRATVRDGKLAGATLIEGGAVTGPCGDAEGGASAEGTVASADPVANTITLDRALPNPEALVGRVVILGNERHQTSYLIRSATVEGGKTVLGFGDVLFLVGMGEVTGTDEQAHTVTTDTVLTGYGKVDGGQHQGRWLLNAAKQYGPRLAAPAAPVLKTEGYTGSLATLFAGKDATGRTRFWIADVGTGDHWRIPEVTTR